MKIAATLFSLVLSVSLASGQLFFQDFNDSIPNSWWRTSSDTNIKWVHNDSLGINGTGCAIADHGVTFTPAGTASIVTPFVNFSAISKPQISFSVALVGNNFVPPDLVLYYDLGGSLAPQKVYSWGGSNSADSNITQTFNQFYPLEAINITWVDITYELPQLGIVPSVSFIFKGELLNGGWVLLDNIRIGGKPSIGIKEEEKQHRLYPNPCSETLHIEGTAEQAEVYNLQGQKLLEQKLAPSQTEHQIPLTKLAKGAYTVKVIEGTNSTTTNVIKE
jgi:hypothetical protein